MQQPSVKLRDKYYKQQTLDINKKEVMNNYDYILLKGGEVEEDVEDVSVQVESIEKGVKSQTTRIPQVPCHLMVSELNKKMH